MTRRPGQTGSVARLLINLHTHLEGRIRPGTAAELAGEAGAPAPVGGWQRALQLDGPADLSTYLQRVAASFPFLADPRGQRCGRLRPRW